MTTALAASSTGQFHVGLVDQQGVAERDQLGGLLGAHDARPDPGDGQDIALLHGAVADERDGLGLHDDPCSRRSRCGG